MTDNEVTPALQARVDVHKIAGHQPIPVREEHDLLGSRDVPAAAW